MLFELLNDLLQRGEQKGHACLTLGRPFTTAADRLGEEVNHVEAAHFGVREDTAEVVYNAFTDQVEALNGLSMSEYLTFMLTSKI